MSQCLKFSSFILSALLAFSCKADVVEYFNSIKKNPKELRHFLEEMPKGGELHYHLAGSISPETMLRIGSQGNYCLEDQRFQIKKPLSEDNKNCIRLSQLDNFPELYQNTIRSWSMQDFQALNESAHDHFFNSFEKFMPLVIDYRPAFVADAMQRAAMQQASYMEIMILADNAQSTQFTKITESEPSFAKKQKALLKNKKFQENIQNSLQYAHKTLTEARTLLSCGTPQASVGCQVTVKFQYYVLREQPIEQVFAQALTGFALANQSKDIIAVNLVQAEDGPISLKDYHRQMQVFGFLHKHYPKVNISLHAGELSPAFAGSKDLSYHIRDAIETGQAQRIGHGVDVLSEKQADALLKTMAQKQIAVEVNLVSNFTILELDKEHHPLLPYLKARVPVVLSTDDEGILRTDLTSQYLIAASDFGLDYASIKQINRNALSYSFIDGKSLWQDAASARPVKACQNLDSPACKQFIQHNAKAELQWQLEKRLATFEKFYSKGNNKNV